MYKTNIKLTDNAAITCANISSEIELIEEYKELELQLKSALAIDDEQKIRQCGIDMDLCFNNMIAYEGSSVSDRKTFYNFLIKRFVLPDYTSPEMRKIVCDKIISIL